MPGQLVGPSGNANQGGGRSCTDLIDDCTNSHFFLSVMRKARSLWPRKPHAELMQHCGVSERTAKYWLAGKRGLSIDQVAGLLRSEEGLEFLEVIMDGAHPVWWGDVRRAASIAAMKKSIVDHQKFVEQEELKFAARNSKIGG